MAMLVIKDDVIKYEEYFSGGDENTLFSSNSMGKLCGIFQGCCRRNFIERLYRSFVWGTISGRGMFP